MTGIAADDALRRAGRLVLASGGALLVLWVLVPIYLLLVNALPAPQEVASFPKRLLPSFDTGSLAFFFGYGGVVDALWNSVQVAAVTMVLSIALGAPAGYALSRFDFPGKEVFRFLVIMTRAFPLPALTTRFWALRWCMQPWRCPSPCSSPSRCSRAFRLNWRKRPGRWAAPAFRLSSW